MKTSSIAIISVAIIVVLIGVSFMGYLVYFKNGQKHITYAELLPVIGILVGLIGIIIAILAVLAGLLLNRIAAERAEIHAERYAESFVEKKARERSDVSAFRAYIEVGHVCYILSKKNPLLTDIPLEDQLLDVAIEEQNFILDLTPPEYWECYAKNNLAFLHAIRDKSKEDIDIAREYSEFVHKKSPDYLSSDREDAIEWRMTKAYVMARHPEKPDEMKQARRLYQSLITLGATSEQERRIQDHMRNFWP